jgi:hypothetical protein
VAPTTTIESEVPSELLALIGAPMPEVDLTIDGPEDVERWISEFLRWEAWTSANPVEGIERLDGFASGQYLEGMREGLERVGNAGVLGVGGRLEFQVTSVEEGDLEAGILSFTVQAQRATTRFTLAAESLGVLHRLDPTGEVVVSDVVVAIAPGGIWQLVEWRSR